MNITLRGLREKVGLTSRFVAGSLGIRVDYFNKIENGIVPLSNRNKTKLAAIYEVTEQILTEAHSNSTH